MTDRLVCGCMTGTSIDALDVALVRISQSGLHMTAEFERHVSRPLGSMKERLRAVAEQQPVTAGEIAAIANELSVLHADAIFEVADGKTLDLVSVHGQTIYHLPPRSMQLINPTIIAQQLAAPVVCDLRAADLAHGGQGAPITPLADWILFRSTEEPRVIANLGGFCNLTLLPRDNQQSGGVGSIRGRDICPCNHLLDRIARRCFGQPFDTDGARALEGIRSDGALTELMDMLLHMMQEGRSLGTGDELDQWITDSLAYVEPGNLAATACIGIAMAIARQHPGVKTHLLLAGGGTRNLALLDAIRDAWAGPVSYVDQFGIPAEAREAVAMAVLGALCQDRVPITLPSVTGVPQPAPVAGVWAY